MSCGRPSRTCRPRTTRPRPGRRRPRRPRPLLPALRAALERDPRDFVANPNGKVTVTEFYDYRCPHCINIAPKVVGLIRSQPDVRFVFKEMPIFGATSEHAARAALGRQGAGQGLRGPLRGADGRPAAGRRRDRPHRRRQGRQRRAMNAPATQSPRTSHLDDIAELAGARLRRHARLHGRRHAFIRGEDFDGLVAAINKAEHKA